MYKYPRVECARCTRVVLNSRHRDSERYPLPTAFAVPFSQQIGGGPVEYVVEACDVPENTNTFSAGVSDKLLLKEGWAFTSPGNTFAIQEWSTPGGAITTTTVGLPPETIPLTAYADDGAATLTLTTSSPHYLLAGDVVYFPSYGPDGGFNRVAGFEVASTPTSTTFTVAFTTGFVLSVALAGTCTVRRLSSPSAAAARWQAAIAATAGLQNSYAVQYESSTARFILRRSAGAQAFNVDFSSGAASVAAAFGFRQALYTYTPASADASWGASTAPLAAGGGMSAVIQNDVIQYASDAEISTDFGLARAGAFTTSTLPAMLALQANSRVELAAARSLVFVDALGARVTATLPAGFYHLSVLATALGAAMTAASTDAGETFTVTADENTGFAIATNRSVLTLLLADAASTLFDLLGMEAADVVVYEGVPGAGAAFASNRWTQHGTAGERYEFSVSADTGKVTVSQKVLSLTASGAYAAGVLTLTSATPHGLRVGDVVAVGPPTGAGGVWVPPLPGLFLVDAVPSSTTFSIAITETVAPANYTTMGVRLQERPVGAFGHSVQRFPGSAMRVLGVLSEQWGGVAVVGEAAVDFRPHRWAYVAVRGDAGLLTTTGKEAGGTRRPYAAHRASYSGIVEATPPRTDDGFRARVACCGRFNPGGELALEIQDTDGEAYDTGGADVLLVLRIYSGECGDAPTARRLALPPPPPL